MTAYSVLHGFSRTKVSLNHWKVTATIVSGKGNEKEQDMPFVLRYFRGIISVYLSVMKKPL